MLQHRQRQLPGAALAAVLLLLAAPAAAQVAVHAADALPGALVPMGEGRATWTSPQGVVIELLLDPAIADIDNPAAGEAFVPVPAALVQDAVDAIDPAVGGALRAGVYCLPGLPARVRRSFCARGEVFLAAALATPSRATVAYSTVHELGHALAHRRLGPGGLEAYGALRGLDPARHHAHAMHRDRPAEIFAEDFRALFGGPDATASGTIENPALPLPQELPALRGFFLEVAAGRWLDPLAIERVGNFPNPFNPRTEIVVELRPELAARGGLVSVDILDARGRRVRSLPARPAAPSLRFAWDGQDGRGARVASGRYSYVVHYAGERQAGHMLLVE